MPIAMVAKKTTGPNTRGRLLELRPGGQINTRSHAGTRVKSGTHQEDFFVHPSTLEARPAS